jgi:hypothetical protein
VAVGVVVAVALVVVRMAQQRHFLEQEEGQQAAQQGREQVRGSAFDSKASGSACSSEVESMMPTDRLTMRSTTFVSRVKENTAAAVMLTTPARPVASRMDNENGVDVKPLVI